MHKKSMPHIVSFAFIIGLVAVQELAGQNFPVHFSTGPSFANVITNNSDFDQRTSYNPGLAVGIGSDIKLFKSTSLVIDFYFMQKGYRFNNRSINNNYLMHNWLVRTGHTFGKLDVFVEGGLVYGSLIGGRSDRTDNPSFDPERQIDGSLDFENVEDFERLDFGLEFGAGFKYAYGPGKFMLNGRLNRGVIIIAKDLPPTGRMYNINYYITFGYEVPVNMLFKKNKSK